jgi:uncharacterized glyoxalase superfamily protein PhnB
MVAIALYLSFSGNCEEAFNFYKSVFSKNFLERPLWYADRQTRYL